MNEGLARRIVNERSGGLCEPRIPDAGCTYLGAEWHHRKRRSQGGLWTPANGLRVCPACHRYVTDTNGDYDRCIAAGWIVRQHDDPAAVPALIHTITLGHGLILLDDEGMIAYAASTNLETVRGVPTVHHAGRRPSDLRAARRHDDGAEGRVADPVPRAGLAGRDAGPVRLPGLLGRGLGDALAVQGGVEGQLGSVRPAARGLT